MSFVFNSQIHFCSRVIDLLSEMSNLIKYDIKFNKEDLTNMIEITSLSKIFITQSAS
ncbi:hypothetical protein APA_1928 [Pseudanabaena sp. lw0831]|nr:hypothetical protein APA_1928 [Pseudanabaena sp. lw0831]